MDTQTSAQPVQTETDFAPLIAQRIGSDALELIRLRAELDRAAARVTQLEQENADLREKLQAAGE